MTLYFTEVYISCKECVQLLKIEHQLSFLHRCFLISHPEQIWTRFPFFCLLLQTAQWIGHNSTSVYTLGGYRQVEFGKRLHVHVHRYSKGVSWGEKVLVSLSYRTWLLPGERALVSWKKKSQRICKGQGTKWNRNIGNDMTEDLVLFSYWKVYLELQCFWKRGVIIPLNLFHGSAS